MIPTELSRSIITNLLECLVFYEIDSYFKYVLLEELMKTYLKVFISMNIEKAEKAMEI